MKTIIVVDNSQSALFIAASARANIIGAEILCANQYMTPNLLFQALIKEEPDMVIFSWRAALFDAAKMKKGGDLIKKLHTKTIIGVVIPDHLGLHPNFWRSEKENLALCDFYVVTNSKLFEEYSRKMIGHPPFRVFHDLPSMDLIDEVRSNEEKSVNSPPRVIWVGNSEWGNRFGFKDHKRFKSLVVPLLTINQESGNLFEFVIIDSSQERLTHREVLQKVWSADILIHTSKSEGTGLPILEALGLGTNVVTTAVGIAPEISARFARQNIAEPSPESFFNKLQLLLSEGTVPVKNLRSDYLSYIEKVKSESLDGVAIRQLSFPKTSPFVSFRTILLWIYRNKMSELSSFR